MRERPHYSLTLRETARHFGLTKALQALVLRALKIRPVVLLAQDVSALRLAPDLGDPGVRPATPEDSGLFERAGFPGMLERKLAEGPGWIKLDQGRLVGWCFLAWTDSHIADWLVLRNDNPVVLWGAGTWVKRDYRGSGVAAQVRNHSFRWYCDKGYREQLSWINLTNHSSLRSWRKLGARTIGRITFLRLLGVALVHDGRRWHLGRWTAAHPLLLSIESIRRDRECAAYDSAEPVQPSVARRS